MNKMTALKVALKHRDSFLVAVELIEAVQRVKREDGTIARADRSRLLSRFWAVVRSVQDSG